MRGLLVLTGVGFFAQLVDGALGMAYGATSSTLLLAAGLAPATASASVHLAELGTTAVSGASHWRFGNIDWETVRRIGIPGAIGAFGGALVLGSVSSELAAPWMAGILLLLGVYILLRFTIWGQPKPRGRHYVRRRYLVPLGLGAGFVDATGGGGWGPVTTPTLLATGKMQPRKVVGSVDTSEFLVALAATLGFLISLGYHGASFKYVVPLLLGGIAAAPLAAWLVQRVPPALLGVSVSGLILLTNSRTMFDALDVQTAVRRPIYLGILLAWAAALAVALLRHRRLHAVQVAEATPIRRAAAADVRALSVHADTAPLAESAANG